MQTAVADLKQRTHGSVFDTITRATFDDLLVVNPRSDTVTAFEAAVQPLFELLLASLHESAHLCEIRDYLLPKLLSGQVRVEVPMAEPSKPSTQRRRDARTQGRKRIKPLGLCALALKEEAMTENDISRHIVDSAIEVHRTLGGPSLLESVYEEALVWELEQLSLPVQRQVSLPIPYKGQTLASPLRIDAIVSGLVIVECKALAQYNGIFEAQALTYLRLTGMKLGLVINFGERMVKNGIHRVVNGL